MDPSLLVGRFQRDPERMIAAFCGGLQMLTIALLNPLRDVGHTRFRHPPVGIQRCGKRGCDRLVLGHLLCRQRRVERRPLPQRRPPPPLLQPRMAAKDVAQPGGVQVIRCLEDHIDIHEHVLAIHPRPVVQTAHGLIAVPPRYVAVDDRPGRENRRHQDQLGVLVEGHELGSVEGLAAAQADDQLDPGWQPVAEVLLMRRVQPLGKDHALWLAYEVGLGGCVRARRGHNRIRRPTGAFSLQQAAGDAHVVFSSRFALAAHGPASICFGHLLSIPSSRQSKLLLL